MIRVTYIYSEFCHSEYKAEYDTYKIEDDCIALYDLKSDGVECELILLSKLIKIEKQVKDLTTEECYKLDATFTNQNEMETYYFEYNGRTYMNTDYIDITNLIKEQGNE